LSSTGNCRRSPRLFRGEAAFCAIFGIVVLFFLLTVALSAGQNSGGPTQRMVYDCWAVELPNGTAIACEPTGTFVPEDEWPMTNNGMPCPPSLEG